MNAKLEGIMTKLENLVTAQLGVTLAVLHVFAAVSLKCFSVISFKARFCHSLFLNCFYGYSCFDLSQFSERLVQDGIKLNWT
jgi:hypothetical protein